MLVGRIALDVYFIVITVVFIFNFLPEKVTLQIMASAIGNFILYDH